MYFDLIGLPPTEETKNIYIVHVYRATLVEN